MIWIAQRACYSGLRRICEGREQAQRLTHIVGLLYIRSGRQERPHHLSVSIVAGPEERCPASLWKGQQENLSD